MALDDIHSANPSTALLMRTLTRAAAVLGTKSNRVRETAAPLAWSLLGHDASTAHDDAALKKQFQGMMELASACGAAADEFGWLAARLADGCPEEDIRDEALAYGHFLNDQLESESRELVRILSVIDHHPPAAATSA